MPRIPTRLIVKAYQNNPLLPLLLRECRSLDSARNELRWLHERALHIARQRAISGRSGGNYPVVGWRGLFRSMCLARSKGVPLQYILGDQPFGDLDIKCVRGVLIPRHETEAITFHAAELILDILSKNNWMDRPKAATLRIMDLCTGTGCIPLLLHALLSPHVLRLSVVGVDISPTAIRLAKENTKRNVRLGVLSERALSEVSFQRGNMLEFNHDGFPTMEGLFPRIPGLATSPEPRCDILISNPPYISPREYYHGTTARSVRIFEPKLALVPPVNLSPSMVQYRNIRREDLFYHHIAALIPRLQVKLAVLECGSHSQAIRVAAMCKDVLGKCNSTGSILVDIWSVTGYDGHPYAVLVRSR
ncbi:S-adenosyl-L-methionine-dependent methyltransferase [Aspergillus cavernicola]|uniref:S-adenosyl-L-methionine-dependent methyltransferase n=1 Tax=Aspergillus cavernicola TaxID=176166 RepID=A0ABR4HLK6_9EURO